MSQVVLQLSRTRVVPSGQAIAASTRSADRANEVVILGVALAVLQILDGYLTAIGVYHFGTSIEGNPLLRACMESYGFVPTLLVAKTIALAIIALLCTLSARVWWLRTAMKGMIAIYLVAAVIPWCFILSGKILA
jgi:hypothetical protein